ncbi:MAG: hypothetical protein JXK94_06820 [Deltaproteobacteria bacterium]|nr:hypothetical protein [Deltaproteobacteria bacterium]
MALPNDAPNLPPGVMLTLPAEGQYVPSQSLVDLLLQARSNYDWPQGTGALPGIRLVIASKIFRFCSPSFGAAIDRHASYFFNSLPLNGIGRATQFFREWANGCQTTSRFAIYNQAGYVRNKEEYFARYLPMLSSIAKAINEIPALYMCIATNRQVAWTPADVEMSAYYWWALNGSR